MLYKKVFIAAYNDFYFYTNKILNLYKMQTCKTYSQVIHVPTKLSYNELTEYLDEGPFWDSSYCKKKKIEVSEPN